MKLNYRNNSASFAVYLFVGYFSSAPLSIFHIEFRSFKVNKIFLAFTFTQCGTAHSIGASYTKEISMEIYLFSFD